MRRWITIILLALLPLQSIWAAAGSYCRHETGIDAQHVGHHEHRHQVKVSDEGKAKSLKTALAIDGDCDFCHLCCGAILVEAPVMPNPLATATVRTLRVSHHLSAILSPPDRPNWQRLV